MNTVPLPISSYLFRLCFVHAARSTLDTVTVPNGVYQYPTDTTHRRKKTARFVKWAGAGGAEIGI